MNAIELLELHSKEATARPWRTTEDGEVLSDVEPTNEDERHTFDLYGGCPVAESVATSDAILITLAVNALPDLLKLARAAMEHCVEVPAVAEALEPLFREEGS